MTGKELSLTGASTASKPWESIDWTRRGKQAKRLQMRITKAVREGRWEK